MLQKINKRNTNFLYSIEMCEQTLKFGDVVINKKHFMPLNKQLL